ncbi:MAG: thiamine diphosphokinase [Clostridia bacterium]|nr:thiamine diphosphokinase [Clostridia bacterium]
MIKTIIVSGGNIDIEFLNNILLSNKFNNIIASDKGLEGLDKCNIKPNYIIGDFDSVQKNVLGKYINDKKIEIIKLSPEKDYTDTHMALKLAIQLKSNEITIVGAIGSRIDHTLSNIHILKEALDNNIKCEILNKSNKITLINKKTLLDLDNTYKYISLIPLTTTVTGITLKEFKYSLTNKILKIGQSIGISNEQIKNKATINISNGILILIQSNDEEEK